MTDHEHDIWESLGRFEGKLDSVGLMVAEIRDEQRRLPCGEHGFRLASLEKRKTSPSEEVERRNRDRWNWRVTVAQRLVPLLIALAAGSGITWAVHCQPTISSAPASQPARR